MNDAASVIELLRSAEASLFPAVNSGALVALLQRVRADLGQEPPADYMGFLRQSDGAIADGLMLYGAQARLVEGADMPALVDINLRRRAYREDLASLLQIGEVDDDIVGYHPAEGLYWRIDRLSGECQEKAADLQELVAKAVTPG